jgi:hypothetical protein
MRAQTKGDRHQVLKLPQYFAKIFSNTCHVALCGAGEHRVESQMTEVRGQRGGTTVSGR